MPTIVSHQHLCHKQITDSSRYYRRLRLGDTLSAAFCEQAVIRIPEFRIGFMGFLKCCGRFGILADLVIIETYHIIGHGFSRIIGNLLKLSLNQNVLNCATFADVRHSNSQTVPLLLTANKKGLCFLDTAL